MGWNYADREGGTGDPSSRDGRLREGVASTSLEYRTNNEERAYHTIFANYGSTFLYCHKH